jgi:hypothetical protein
MTYAALFTKLESCLVHLHLYVIYIVRSNVGSCSDGDACVDIFQTDLVIHFIDKVTLEVSISSPLRMF